MLKVCGHRVLVKVPDVEEVDDVIKRAKAVGIELSIDKKAEQLAVDRGTVVQIGQTAFKDFGGEAWCSVGDEVFFSRYGGKVLEDPYSKEKYTCLNDEDIVAIITKE